VERYLTQVNLVAKSKLEEEINLESLMEIDFESFEYHPETFPGASIKIDSSLPNILIFSSGKFMIQGAGSKEEVKEVITDFKRKLDEGNIISEFRDPDYKVVNRVFKLELDKELNLDKISINGLKGEIEYVPEQSPYIVYRPENFDSVITISSTGNCVLNGITNKESAKEVSRFLISQLEEKNLM
jgi:TATA-box binding protein (TBP) (component of TFIID and TFIIIB)